MKPKISKTKRAELIMALIRTLVAIVMGGLALGNWSAGPNGVGGHIYEDQCHVPANIQSKRRDSDTSGGPRLQIASIPHAP